MENKKIKSPTNQNPNSKFYNPSKGKFLDEGNWCLYLDEFAASRIFVPSPEAEWADISVLIKQGINSGKILCPYSIEQMIESTGLDKKSASLLDSETRKFCSGWFFYNEADISANYLICRVRQIKMQKLHFLHNNEQKGFNEPDTYEELGKRNEIFREMVQEVAESVNIVRKASQNAPQAKKSVRDLLVKHIKNSYAEDLKKRMFWLGYYRNYKPTPIKLAGQNILFWADFISLLLTKKHSMTQIEAQTAFWILEKEGIDAIPSLSIRASLEAIMAYKGLIESPNDQMDILRIAGALPFADIMVIDSSKAHDVRELGLNKKFQTDVYSGKKKDLINLREQLTKIISSA
jgi:hypothetical protein